MPKPVVQRKRSSVKEIADAVAREWPGLEASDYLQFILAQRLGRAITSFDERRYRRVFGISGPEMRILFALRRSGTPYALRPTQLFHSLLVTSGTLSKQVDRLQSLGYVTREPGPINSGGSLISLTTSGIELTNRGMSMLGVWSKQFLTSLDSKERELFCNLCGKLIADLEAHSDADAVDERSELP